MKTAVLLSGGIDSTTALAQAVDTYGAENVIALSVLYGQKHKKELNCAEKIANYYGVQRISFDVTPLFSYSHNSLMEHSDKAVPQTSYAEQIEETKGRSPVSTYVPFRNGIFLSAAAGVALSLDCERVVYGAHADDAAGAAYPDCSPAFFDAMKTAVYEGTGGGITLEAPFIHMNKADIVAEGLRLHVPYELTWSCYEGGDKPCGLCGTCRDREAAFVANGTIDPLLKGK